MVLGVVLGVVLAPCSGVYLEIGVTVAAVFEGDGEVSLKFSRYLLILERISEL